jgi:hypothetical protein
MGLFVIRRAVMAEGFEPVRASPVKAVCRWHAARAKVRANNVSEVSFAIYYLGTFPKGLALQNFIDGGWGVR